MLFCPVGKCYRSTLPLTIAAHATTAMFGTTAAGRGRIWFANQLCDLFCKVSEFVQGLTKAKLDS